MIRIGIYSKDLNIKKEIKKLIIQYFDDLNLNHEINYIRTRMKALNNLIEGYIAYDIVIICDSDKITYIKKNTVNNKVNYKYQIVGWLNFPLDKVSIGEIIYSMDDYSYYSGIFGLKTKKTIRVIMYKDIEFCQRVDRKTLIYLSSKEIEETSESLKSIKSKLPEDYFVDCLKGYIINLYNVKKIDRTNNVFVMNSGFTIHISKNKYLEVVRLYIKIMFGI